MVTCFLLYIYIKNIKDLLVRNRWTDFHIIWQKCFFGNPVPRLFKPWWFVKKQGRQGCGLFSLYIYIENFKNLLVRSHSTDFNMISAEMFFWWPCTKLFKLWWKQTYGRQGMRLFFPYMSIWKTLKNILFRSHLNNFNIIWQKCSFRDPVLRLFKPWWFVKKWPLRDEAYFPKIAIWKTFLSETIGLTDFNIMWQKYSFGDPVPRLLKPWWFIGKHGHQGAGRIFPYICKENFKNLLVRTNGPLSV